VLADPREPPAVDQDLRDAVAAYRTGKLDEVEALCGRILERQPDDVGSLQLLAAAAAHRREPRRGIELLEKVISLRPDSVDGYIQLAKLQRLEKLISEPIAALKKAIELKPDSAGAYNDLGLIYLEEFCLVEALDCFDRAIKIDRDLTVAHFNRGAALESQGARAEAIGSFRRVVEIDPNFPEAHVRLGDLLLFEDERENAINYWRRSAALRPGSILASTSEAKILMEERREGAAEELMRRAIELHPHNSSAHGLMGTILMRLGRFHDAAAHFDLSLALNRRQTAAYHALVHVKKLADADRPMLSQIEWMLREYSLADNERTELHFALGKDDDDLGEYDAAITHFDQGNRLKRQYVLFDRDLHAQIANGAIARFSADFFSRNDALGSDSEVPILIVGMPRSGTMLVEQILSSHPEIAAGGELTFWGERAARFRANAVGQIDPAWIEETAHDYRMLLAGISPTARRVTDKRRHNFLLLGLIHSVFPRARIIHCRRHPVDTCLSIYFQDFASRMDFAYDRGDLVYCYRHYHELMAHWRSVLPPDCFLEIQYEGLVANRQAETRKLIGFCGLEWNDACLRSERNPRAVQTASVWQARQAVYQTSVARWRHYEPWLGALRDLLPNLD
jgi:tetratricopeptide (TPR) repeat protein